MVNYYPLFIFINYYLSHLLQPLQLATAQLHHNAMQLRALHHLTNPWPGSVSLYLLHRLLPLRLSLLRRILRREILQLQDIAVLHLKSGIKKRSQ